jgi:hypothetical protein
VNALNKEIILPLSFNFSLLGKNELRIKLNTFLLCLLDNLLIALVSLLEAKVRLAGKFEIEPERTLHVFEIRTHIAWSHSDSGSWAPDPRVYWSSRPDSARFHLSSKRLSLDYLSDLGLVRKLLHLGFSDPLLLLVDKMPVRLKV